MIWVLDAFEASLCLAKYGVPRDGNRAGRLVHAIGDDRHTIIQVIVRMGVFWFV